VSSGQCGMAALPRAIPVSVTARTHQPHMAGAKRWNRRTRSMEGVMHRSKHRTALSTLVTQAVAILTAVVVLPGILQICAAGEADDATRSWRRRRKPQWPTSSACRFRTTSTSVPARRTRRSTSSTCSRLSRSSWPRTGISSPGPSCPSSTSRRCSRGRAPSGRGTSTRRSSCRRRSPASSSGGVGPTFTVPTATDSLLGSSQWSMGPAAVDGEHTVVSWRHEAIP
jgi:hypothetical protein